MQAVELRRFLEAGLSLEEIGRRLGRHPSTVRKWVDRFGLAQDYERSRAHKPAIRRDDLIRLVETGASHSEMARSLGSTRPTVQYALRKHCLETRRAVRRGEVKAAKRAGRATATLVCPKHGATDYWLEGRGSYRCMRCRSERVALHRKKVKAQLVTEAGGSCQICGYDRFPGGLQFHHRDPTTKSFGIAHKGVTRSVERARAEMEKCVLLCGNCHAEVEAGLAVLP